MELPNPNTTLNNDTTPRGTGPISRTWPQLFKKRRRTSPPRDPIQEQQLREENTLPPILKLPLPRSTRTMSIASGSDNASLAPSLAPSTATRSTSTTTSSARSNSSSMTTSTARTNSTSTSATSISSRSPSISTASPTQASLLAAKSNYEWIASGRSAEMGLHFSTAMATGIMMRRQTHRQSEQARRDRMRSALIELAEYVVGGEVEFGAGTSCFVVAREGDDGETNGVIEEEGEDEGGPAGAGGKGGKGKGKNTSKEGRKGRNINKARIIEMALEKMREQEREIRRLEERMAGCNCGEGGDRREVEGGRMDMSQ